MSRFILVISFLCCSLAQAQDFTNEIEDQNLEHNNEKILIVPFKSQFLLSEIDRGLVNNSGKEVFEIRTSITHELVNETANMFPDSITCRVLNNDIESSNLSFIYHQLSYGYAEIPTDKDQDKKKFSLKSKINEKSKRSDVNTPAGYKTKIEGGQISKDPIFNERYMSATIKSAELMEFIESEYEADVIVVFTELDLMKAKGNKMLEEFEYIATLHYVIFDKEGNLIEGNKIEKYFNKSEFNLTALQANVLTPLSQSIHDRTILYLGKNSPTKNEGEDKDY